MNLEPKHPRYMPPTALLRDQGRVDLEEDVVERGAEVRAVDGGVTGRFRVVDVFAFDAVHLYRFLVRDVGLAHGKQWVGVADHAWAFAEISFFVFVELGEWRGQMRFDLGLGSE
jgi:hypothetical protein